MSDIFYYLFPHDLPPTFVVDISDYVDPWVEALQCHRSQFYNPHTQRYDAIDRFLAVARPWRCQRDRLCACLHRPSATHHR